MSLEQRLDRIREGFAKQAPAEALAIFHRATDDLRATGIADSALGEGSSAPDFQLKSSRGDHVSLAGLRAKGPVVVQFYRGHW